MAENSSTYTANGKSKGQKADEAEQNTPATEAAQSGAAASVEDGDPTLSLQNKLKEAEQKYVYLYAEFENFKKRAVKERQDVIKYGWESVASDLLGVLDNLDRALQFAKPDSDANLINGLKLVTQQFRTTLEKQGVQPITTENQPFNPEIHESVGELPSEKPAGVIVQEAQKGYLLHGRLLRASRVLLSAGPASAAV